LANMQALHQAGCVVMSNARRPVTNTLVQRRAMEYAATLGLTVFINAEDPWLAADGCIHEGPLSTRMGLPGIPECAEVVAVGRDLMLIEQTGVRAHFSQLSSARAVEMIAQARARGLPVTADVSAHQLFLTEMDVSDFNSLCHVSPPLRSERDRDSPAQPRLQTA
jgi:dihydroorotase